MARGRNEPLGLVPDDRLHEIPSRYHAEHEVAFFIHDNMVSLLKEMYLSNAIEEKLTLAPGESEILEHSADIFEFLENSGRTSISQRMTLNQFGLAMFADICDHIHTALICLEKRKFTVAMNLLRKPLKEGFFLIAYATARPDEFFKKMKDEIGSLYVSNVQQEERNKIFDEAINVAASAPFLDAASIQSSFFDRKNDDGFAGLFDKAAHYITTFKGMETESWNINFIYKDRSQNDIYHNIYPLLLKTLLLMHLMQINMYRDMQEPRYGYIRWLEFVTSASYQALFLNGRSPSVEFVNRHMAEFLECSACKEPMKLKKREAAKFFLCERIICASCNFDQNFPFGWIFSKTEEE